MSAYRPLNFNGINGKVACLVDGCGFCLLVFIGGKWQIKPAGIDEAAGNIRFKLGDLICLGYQKMRFGLSEFIY